MLRKPRKSKSGWLLAVSMGWLLTPLAGWGQGVDTPVRMWAATASYVYHDDPDLRDIASQLDTTVHGESLTRFRSGLARAVKLEKTKLGHENLKKFQAIVEELQQQKLTEPVLAAAIVQELSGNKRRMKDAQRQQGLTRLGTELDKLAAGAVGSGRPLQDSSKNKQTATDTGRTTPLPPPATSVEPQPWWQQWLGIGLAALSLAGLAWLWSKYQDLQNRASRHRDELDKLMQAVTTLQGAPSVEMQVKREVAAYSQRNMSAQPNPTAQAEKSGADPVSVVPATAPAVERTRRQYVSEAPLNRVLRAPVEQAGQYSIFAVEVNERNPDLGMFFITGNLASHIRNHRSVLEPVCEYVGSYPLGNETRLITEQNGEVRRTADGNWEVTRPARIRFEP